MKKNLTICLLFLLAAAVGCSTIKDLGKTSEGVNSSANNSTLPSNLNNAESNSSVDEDNNSVNEGKSDVAGGSGEYAPTDDPTGDIKRLSDRFLNQKTFRAVMEINGKTSMEMELEFQAPDSFRLTNHLTSDKTMEMIVIGKQAYMNLNGKWMKVPTGLGNAKVTDMREMFNKEGLKWFRDVKYVGEEQVEGKDAYVYTYSGKLEGKSDYDSRIWVGKTDGMPLKINVEYKSGDLKSVSIKYDYTTPVSIEAPIK